MAKIFKNKASHRILAIMAGSDRSGSLKLIELAGRTSYQSREKITEDSAKKFVKMLRNRGHESVLEHSAMTVEFNNVSRGFTHELVRHRVASFTQESTRYVDESDFEVVAPPDKDINKKVKIKTGKGNTADISFKQWVNLNEQMYRALRKAGWIQQDARQILPIGITSQIVITANFREWRHIFELRCAADAHWEIRQTMFGLLKEVQQKVPVIFDNFKINDQKQTAVKK